MLISSNVIGADMSRITAADITQGANRIGHRFVADPDGIAAIANEDHGAVVVGVLLSSKKLALVITSASVRIVEKRFGRKWATLRRVAINDIIDLQLLQDQPSYDMRAYSLRLVTSHASSDYLIDIATPATQAHVEEKAKATMRAVSEARQLARQEPVHTGPTPSISTTDVRSAEGHGNPTYEDVVDDRTFGMYVTQFEKDLGVESSSLRKAVLDQVTVLLSGSAMPLLHQLANVPTDEQERVGLAKVYVGLVERISLSPKPVSYQNLDPVCRFTLDGFNLVPSVAHELLAFGQVLLDRLQVLQTRKPR
jgi:hypothetical protein